MCMTKEFKERVPVSRAAQADKITAILRDFIDDGLEELRCLEIGCGDGEISCHLARAVGGIWGLEVDGEALRRNRFEPLGLLRYTQADGRRLPFEAESFDLVILAQVYEHMRGQETLSEEIYRALKPGGICFFSGPNRFRLIEPHYFLPFLSWLPHWMSNIYLRATGRGKEFDIFPRSYWGIKHLWRRFCIIDYTWRLIKTPELFVDNERLGQLRFFKRLPTPIIKLLKPFYPNYNWILVKENGV